MSISALNFTILTHFKILVNVCLKILTTLIETTNGGLSINTHYMCKQQAHRSSSSLGHKHLCNHIQLCVAAREYTSLFSGSLSLLLPGACGTKAFKGTTLVCLVIHDGVRLLRKPAPDGTVVYSKVKRNTKLTTSEDALY